MRETNVRLKPDATPRAYVLAAALLALAPAAAPHARVELIADSTAVTPGGDVTLGLRFILDEGWHIYWRNPGESGAPPVVTWRVPPELVVSDIQWPVPEKFAAPDDTTYGYQRRVLLLAPAKYAGKQAGTTLPIEATVDYQICREICVKETARLSAALATGAPAPSETKVEFDAARDRLPKPMAPRWKAAASVSGAEVVLTITTGEKETAGTFLPYLPGLIDDGADQRVEPRPDGIALVMKRAPAAAEPSTIDGLLLRPGKAAVEICVMRNARCEMR